MVQLILPLISLSLLAAPAPKAATPEAVVRALFADHFSHGMGFTKASVSRKARWLTTGFQKQLNAELDKPASPDEAPTINGDPFTDSQEYPTRFVVGKAVRTGLAGPALKVSVTFKGNGRHRIVVALLMETPDGWRVDDLGYEDGKTLRSLLGK